MASRAFRFTVLCALRKGETTNLRWSDISSNGDGPVLTISADRTKQAREHRVPLSSGALALIEEQRALRGDDDLIFPSPIKIGVPMHPGVFNDLLARMGYKATPHGVARSSFRDWIADCTEFPRDLAEMCLGHVEQDLTLLWQIFLGKAFLGFLKRVLRDSWVVGVTEGRPWMRPGNSILSGGLRLFSVLFGIRREHGCARFMWRG